MGLNICVGMLADLIKEDPDGAEDMRLDLTAINVALAAHGFATHDEPEDAPVWDAAVYGYAGLHALREYAGYMAAGQDVPRDVELDGSQTAQSDAVVEAFLKHINGSGELTLVGRLFRSLSKKSEPAEAPRFQHLIVHSDCDGYYVPVHFERPLAPRRTTEATEHLFPLGSVFRLEAEINTLADHMELPADIGLEDRAFDGERAQSPEAPLWRVQPTAAQACAVLREACHRALHSGAAIAFC